MELREHHRQLFDAKTYATVGTLMPDGSPQLTVVWVARDGDDLLISTVIGRQKEKNLRRDPRVSVLAVHPTNPYDYVEIRGTATLSTDGVPELIQRLSAKYAGRPYTGDGPDDQRVVVRVRPERVISRA